MYKLLGLEKNLHVLDKNKYYKTYNEPGSSRTYNSDLWLYFLWI